MRTLLGAAALACLPLIVTPAGAATQIFSDIGVAPGDIEDTVQAFRDALGVNNGNGPTNDGPDGFRSINWDAAPDAVSDPNAFPGDFFNADFAPRARGIVFSPTGTTTGFQLSSTAASGEPVEFGIPDAVQTFSPERLFAPTGGTTFQADFFDPRNPAGRASTRGLGVVFTGIQDPGSVHMTFLDAGGNPIDTIGAGGTLNGVTSPTEDGFLFLGALIDDPLVFSVAIQAGSQSIDGQGTGDIVAMDDVIFGEPIPVQPVPLPAPVSLLLGGLGALVLLRRRAV